MSEKIRFIIIGAVFGAILSLVRDLLAGSEVWVRALATGLACAAVFLVLTFLFPKLRNR